VRLAEVADLPSIRSILAQWLSIDDVDEHAAAMLSALNGDSDATYIVAGTEDGSVVGLAGLEARGIASELVLPGERPVEVVSVYVDQQHIGLGVGRGLVDEAERRATAAGYTTIIVVSGSRNRKYGYPFWCHRYGEPFRCDADYFGFGAERVVWRRALPTDR